MKVLKVVGEGFFTSFRYPHFMQGVQPSFEMPPPATLYGFVCSVLGKWFDPRGVKFSVNFSYEAKIKDIEHTHVLKPAKGKIKGTGIPKVIEGSINPFKRELLFQPRLTLYINRPEWISFFKTPQYPVSLGRSQDLFTLTNIELVDLKKSDDIYLENTLAPYSYIRRTGKGIVSLMPRFLDYYNNRFPEFCRYVILQRRIYASDLLLFDDETLSFWSDPKSCDENGKRLGLIFHSWVDDDDSIN